MGNTGPGYPLRRRDFLKHAVVVGAALAIPACRENGPRTGNSRVLIIGAGMSGLAAGSELASRGFEVTVLEARNRLGGRIFTDKSLGSPIDFGAQWIEGTDGNPLTGIAGRIGAPTFEMDEDNTALFTGTPMRRADNEALGMAAESLEARASRVADEAGKDISLRTAIDDALDGQAPSAELEWIFKTLELGVSDDLDKASAWYSDDDDGFNGSSVVLPDGYEQLAKDVAGRIEIRYGEPVREIRHTRDGVVAVTLAGEHQADRVVVTLPLGVLKSGDVTFDPPLPARKREAIDRLGFGAVTKLALRFEREFWPPDFDYFGYAPPGGARFAVTMNVSRFQKAPVLLAYAAGDDARSLGSVPDREIVSEATSALRDMFGGAALEPDASAVWRWASDPFALGAYSYVTVGNSSDDYDVLAEPIGDRLHFAGEATNRAYRGTVHGAFLSGVREARRIARS